MAVVVLWRRRDPFYRGVGGVQSPMEIRRDWCSSNVESPHFFVSSIELDESPSFELMKLLLKRGAVLTDNDPHVPSLPKIRHDPDLPAMVRRELTPKLLASQDCVLISTDHSAFDHGFIVKHSRLVLDTRNATKTSNWAGKRFERREKKLHRLVTERGGSLASGRSAVTGTIRTVANAVSAKRQAAFCWSAVPAFSAT
jgi:UDP-glucose/GDP-mannose dehydrogenase family, UDP binding domain